MALDATTLRGLRALTFDCYGTLIDWDGGVASAARALTSCAGCDLERLVIDREEEEKTIEAGPYLPYGEVLAESLRRAAARQDAEPTDDELERFAASMLAWQPFPDSGGALRVLGERFRIGILSNVEARVLSRSIELLEARVDVIVTAEDVRSYKPARPHFDEGLKRLALPKESVLHVAGSPFHDVAPARELGWNTVWIDRRGEGLAPDAPVPDMVLPDVASLVDALEPAG